jgi:hypothetical protein
MKGVVAAEYETGKAYHIALRNKLLLMGWPGFVCIK